MNTFTAHGQVWNEHKPGDEMPVDGDVWVHILWRSELTGNYHNEPDKASEWIWRKKPLMPEVEIIGWRLAEVKPSEPTADEMLERNIHEAYDAGWHDGQLNRLGIGDGNEAAFQKFRDTLEK